MSFIKLDGIGDVKERVAAPEDKYDVVITDAELKEGKEEGKLNIRLIMEIESGDYANVFHHMSLPNADDEASTKDFKLLSIKRTCEEFNVPYNDGGIELQQFVGGRANVRLTQEEYNGEISNKYSPAKIAED